MEKTGAHFVVLPERREELWQRLLDFLGAWGGVPETGRGVDQAELDAAESALGLGFPAALREFYAEFGGLIGAGYFSDGSNALLRPSQCRLVGDRGDGGETLVIGDEYFGAMWGVRGEDIVHADPRIRCIDSGGEPTDDLFSLTEFLVGLAFRATIARAPIHLQLKISRSAQGTRVEADRIHRELLARFPSWDRGTGERDCGFLSHIESDEIIAALTAGHLDLGLRSEASISKLPEPLARMIAALARSRD